MNHPLGPLFKSASIGFFQGTAEAIDTESQTDRVRSVSGDESDIEFDWLILAAGSAVVRPNSVTGLEQYAFDIDSLASAGKLEFHLNSLKSLPQSKARDIVVVWGGGLPGIELAAEFPRLLHNMDNVRIVLVESAQDLGPELGAGPRPTITKILKHLRIKVKLWSAVTAIKNSGVALASNKRIETRPVVWTADMRATPLTQQIRGTKDHLSRLHIDQYLRILACKHVFATGDAAHAIADTKGHAALMFCQHANILGRFSGHNAAAAFLGEPMIAYSQPEYNCCINLGFWGAMTANGWDREVKIIGHVAKQPKKYVNQKLIYPPQDAKEAIKAADPACSDSYGLFK
ncbi:hypothetical protein B0J15DRAFT_471043 [Fusarium solani]|uniref:FAD/NAD(P)-binding domain-containing protein n=1 Tax=Fusarium solani TaxID=169388 RepID=A0A9P9JTF4_FUSSL|nr:uncharacterized protein B0J15DRAFT_471043 [Fusarium solani]KAH7237162.1 hypothetical protein B0J15DRAFT_471043 [Fusarium solani]